MGFKRILTDTATVPQLTLITDSSRFSGDPFFKSVEMALRGGVDALLVREKSMDSARLLAFSSRLRKLAYQYRARLIIHTQADVAAAVGADGVHVGSADIQNIPAIRMWLGESDQTVSASCHNLNELEQAQSYGADYVFLSPVFPTATHPGAPHLGIEGFQQLASRVALPVIALGGITVQNFKMVEADGYAVIEALLGSEDPEGSAQAIVQGRL